MSRGEKFVSGTSILWGKLAKATVGTLFLTYSLGVSGFLNAIGAAWYAFGAGLASFGADLSTALITSPASGLAAVWRAPLAFLRVFGPWAPVFAIGLILVVLWIRPGVFGRGD